MKRSYILINAIIIIFMCTSTLSTYCDPFCDTKQKILIISDEEKAVLEKLFTMGQEVFDIKKIEQQTKKEIDETKNEINNLQRTLKIEEFLFSKRQNAVKEILKSYQRMGSSSYIEILLDSDSIADLIKRINILKDMSKNTAELLEELKVSKKALLSKNQQLQEKLLKVQSKKIQLEEAIAKKNELIKKENEYLASLGEQKKEYQEYLDAINNEWGEIKLVFPKIINEFSTTIEKGDIPPQAIDINFNIFNISGTLYDAALNEYLHKTPNLKDMDFKFYENSVEVSILKYNLKLFGTFEVREGQILDFVVNKASFYNIPLEKSKIDELFDGKNIELSLKSLLGSIVLDSVKIKEGCIEIIALSKWKVE